MSPSISRDDTVDEEHEMADFGEDRNTTESLDRSHSPGPLLPIASLGEPSSKPPVTWLDAATIALALVAFAVAVAVIWMQEAAVYLGQTNQLVVVGFALSVMNLAAQRQIQLAAIFAEVHYGHSKLTNLDALLRKSFLPRRLSKVPRLVLLVLVALPLSLSAGYKKFSGGFSTINANFGSSQWGFVSRPGWPWSGNGLSGAIDAYVPFWTEVGIGTYGYNMFVASNTTAALLDTPHWETIYAEQSQLRPREYVTLNTTVNATVAEYTEIPPSDRENPEYWESLRSRGFENTTIDMSYDLYSALFAPIASNFSEIYLSIWDATNETFESTAQLFTQTRQLCQGKWNVSTSNVTLIAANLLSPTEDQTVIQNFALNIGNWFTELLPEFNYRWYPPQNPTGINTFPPLVASMVWARVVSHNGHQNVDRADQDPGHAARTLYSKIPQDVQKTYTVVTLQRSGWLLFLLAVNPLLVILAALFKGLLYSVPISDDFGLVALLSGVKESCLGLLRGAGLSGRLRDDVHVRFEVVDEDENGLATAEPRTRIVLEKFGASSNVSGKIKRKVVYG